MTQEELIKRLRVEASKVGPLHADWDLIFDLEAIGRGGETLLSRDAVIAMANARIAELEKQDS